MSMFIQQTNIEPNTELKLYFIYAMGTLIRYASIIGSHICKDNIFGILSNLVKHGNLKVGL